MDVHKALLVLALIFVLAAFWYLRQRKSTLLTPKVEVHIGIAGVLFLTLGVRMISTSIAEALAFLLPGAVMVAYTAFFWYFDFRLKKINKHMEENRKKMESYLAEKKS